MNWGTLRTRSVIGASGLRQSASEVRLRDQPTGAGVIQIINLPTVSPQRSGALQLPSSGLSWGRADQGKLTFPDPITELYWFNGLALLLVLHEPLLFLGRTNAY